MRTNGEEVGGTQATYEKGSREMSRLSLAQPLV